jgi:hypothetical protein
VAGRGVGGELAAGAVIAGVSLGATAVKSSIGFCNWLQGLEGEPGEGRAHARAWPGCAGMLEGRGCQAEVQSMRGGGAGGHGRDGTVCAGILEGREGLEGKA